MKYPKLKNPILCRFLPYILVLGCGLLPLILAFALPVPDTIRVIVLLGSLVGLLYYILRNFLVLMSMDMALAILSCQKTARAEYPLTRSPDAVRNSILHYGTDCEPAPIHPQPAALRYRFSSPMTVYSRGIERVIAAYEVDHLDIELYRDIFRSAKVNAKALTGKKKALFLDSQQKKQPLHRVTVILILAHRVDDQLSEVLYETVCKQCGNENTDCLVPCIVDLEHSLCVFNSLRLPYVGFGYPAKNRGIRIIKNKVFGGRLPWKDNPHLPEFAHTLDLDTSLWDFWKNVSQEVIGADRATKRRFQRMPQGEILTEGGMLYMKWDQRGICQSIISDEEHKTVSISPITHWAYPKHQPIGKKTIRKIEETITAYFQKQGYLAVFQIADS